jgi:RNA polymerase sigma factor (sigma-70 family)
MTTDSLHTVSMHDLVDRIQAGDNHAQDELLRRTLGRMERLARKLLSGFPSVQNWEQTEDVLQNVSLRLLRSLRELKPENTRAFFGLAAEHIRRELLDLHRRYQGPLGLGKNIARTGAATPDGESGCVSPAVDQAPSMERLEQWQAFHEAVERLSAEEREVFGLVFYHGWTQPEIAALFQVHERTVRRIWQAACLRLNKELAGNLPID